MMKEVHLDHEKHLAGVDANASTRREKGFGGETEWGWATFSITILPIGHYCLALLLEHASDSKYSATVSVHFFSAAVSG